MVTDPHTQTHPPTNKQTGPITIHCTAASAQCNKRQLLLFIGASLYLLVTVISCKQAGGRHIWPRPSPPSVGAEAPRAAVPTAAPADGNVAVGSHGEYFLKLSSPLQLPDVETPR